jgi:peptidoglycan hydrolase-like protein with peptidoglycan-binding domain
MVMNSPFDNLKKVIDDATKNASQLLGPLLKPLSDLTASARKNIAEVTKPKVTAVIPPNSAHSPVTPQPPKDLGPVHAKPPLPEGPRDTIGMQRALAYHGLYKGPIDGIDGPETEKAVREFQKSWVVRDGMATKIDAQNPLKKGDLKLTVDGIYGPATHKVLEASITGKEVANFSSVDWLDNGAVALVDKDEVALKVSPNMVASGKSSSRVVAAPSQQVVPSNIVGPSPVGQALERHEKGTVHSMGVPGVDAVPAGGGAGKDGGSQPAEAHISTSKKDLSNGDAPAAVATLKKAIARFAGVSEGSIKEDHGGGVLLSFPGKLNNPSEFVEAVNEAIKAPLGEGVVVNARDGTVTISMQ